MGETMIPVSGGARLCAEAFGDPGDPAVLLIAGMAQSMDWWEDEFCRSLAARGRLVLRYDARDTGRSTCYPPGSPGYGAPEFAADAIAVLDAFGAGRAHVLGLSMGGGVAQRLAFEYRDRLASLTLVATSAIDPRITGLPGPAPELATAEAAEPDWSDRAAVIEHLVLEQRRYAGPDMFDEARTRAIATRVVERSVNMAAGTNHMLLQDSQPVDARLDQLGGLPTLVLHGTVDPLFPLPHGEALAAAIPGARLVPLPGVGHEQPPPSTWDLVLDELIRHTAAAQVDSD